MTVVSNSAHIEALARQWRYAKEREQDFQSERRRIEDQLRDILEMPHDLEGVTTIEVSEDVTIKVTGRIDRKVDADKIQEVAAAAGLSELLPTLFRWKPEINLRKWRDTDPSITDALAEAITAKPGRPSFNVNLTETSKTENN
jgi:hypothetical protein